MERIKRLITVGRNSRHTSLLQMLTDSGYTLHPPREKGEAVILPMPYSTDGTHITGDTRTLAQVLSEIPRDTPVLGGRFDREAYMTAARYGARLFDYFEDEAVQIANAALTARAAVKIGAERLRRENTRVLVCGFGRIGRCLMNLLSGSGTDATVSLRRDTDKAWAEALGHRWVDVGALNPSDYDLIFNTVPAVIFTSDKLERLKEDAFFIELASPPYGIDMISAERMGVKYTVASGLPGKMYPEEAGTILGRSALSILRQVTV